MEQHRKKSIRRLSLIACGLLFLAHFDLMAWAQDKSMSDMPAMPPGHVHPMPAVTDTGSFFSHLLKVYTPRRICMFYEGPLISLHVISDALIFLAYYSIPFALVYFVRRRRDIVFGLVFWMFAAFILACGTTHLFGVIDVWQPYYRLDGIVKAITAGLSIVTAIALWKLMPQLLAIPSASALEATVQVRTGDLEKANADLKQAEKERERLLQAERAARTEAERANHLKDEFLATLSHELRTPLNAILGWSQLLRQPDRDATDLTEGLAVIERNSRAQTQLISDLLDMSRIMSGKFKLEMQPINLAEVVQAALASVDPAAAAKNISLEAELDKHLPPLHGDSARLQQVVLNILTNAIKFTPAGGKVNIALRRAGDCAQIVISDTGQGISPAFLPHVFERFRQSDGSTTRRHGGLGIGLSIVKNIVESHGGTVVAASAGEGHGATFTVTLPFAAAQNDRSSVKSQNSMVNASADRNGQPIYSENILAGVKVLVVDDQPDAVDLAARVLSDRRAQVFTANSAADAFKILQREKPDVLVSDIGMPDEDGYQLSRKIRAIPASEGGQTRAVAVTAYAQLEDQRRAIAAGFNAYIAKPIEPAHLVDVVATLAGKTQSAK